MRFARTLICSIFIYFKMIYYLRISQIARDNFTKVIKIYLIFEYLISYLWHGHQLFCYILY